MYLINPIGREVSSGTGITPRACLCNNSRTFSAGRGSDSCRNCGHHCNGTKDNLTANKNAAKATNRRS